jgi:hypothetical protein
VSLNNLGLTNTDVSHAKGNLSVRYQQDQAMKAVVDVVRNQQQKLEK